jgi:hypothetical protein
MRDRITPPIPSGRAIPVLPPGWFVRTGLILALADRHGDPLARIAVTLLFPGRPGAGASTAPDPSSAGFRQPRHASQGWRE